MAVHQFHLMRLLLIVTGDGTHSAVYGWTDTGDGVVSNGEVFFFGCFK